MSARDDLIDEYGRASTTIVLAATQAAPFTGVYATASDAVIALGIGLIGLALTPHQKGRTQ